MKFRMIAGLVLGAVFASAASDAPKRLEQAALAFKEVMGIPDKAIPQELLNKAQCIVIVPDLKKGAFIIGGKYGRGFVSCRKNGAGWSAVLAWYSLIHLAAYVGLPLCREAMLVTKKVFEEMRKEAKPKRAPAKKAAAKKK